MGGGVCIYCEAGDETFKCRFHIEKEEAEHLRHEVWEWEVDENLRRDPPPMATGGAWELPEGYKIEPYRGPGSDESQ
jgi:hypothetical protein